MTSDPTPRPIRTAAIATATIGPAAYLTRQETGR